MFEKLKENLVKKSAELEETQKFVKKKSLKDAIAKFLSDFLPLIIFVLVYKFSSAKNPILPATFWMIIVTFFALIISYFLTKKIAKMPLFSAVLLGVFGALTLFSGNELFIKIKPTLINLIFASILFFGYFTKRPLISYLFAGELKLKGDSWLTLSFRWAIFFVFLALLNEVIWRNFSTDFWVNFKMFGILPISIIFTISQVPFMMKNIEK